MSNRQMLHQARCAGPHGTCVYWGCQVCRFTLYVQFNTDVIPYLTTATLLINYRHKRHLK